MHRSKALKRKTEAGFIHLLCFLTHNQSFISKKRPELNLVSAWLLT